MKCLVTAGPAYERIDQVRRLTNFSTGRLGSELAEFLAAHGHEVMLLRSDTAVFQKIPGSTYVELFSTAADLREKIELAAAGFGPSAVFHAAAVSDFECVKIFTGNLEGELKELHSGKVPSDRRIFLELVPARKIIESLRGWFPRAFLAGWKYEVEGGREGVLDKARNQLVKCETDVCVANGPGYGAGFGLVARGGAEHFVDGAGLYGALERRMRAGEEIGGMER